MRQISVTFTDQDAGWLKGVADPQSARALAAIHHNISFTVIGRFPCQGIRMSRSAFRGRFHAARRMRRSGSDPLAPSGG